MLTLCRTLMGDPKLVMIDEPTEGLAPKIVEQVARLPRGRSRERGIPILLVEQKLDIALDISERVYVLGHGQGGLRGHARGPAGTSRHPERMAGSLTKNGIASRRGAMEKSNTARYEVKGAIALITFDNPPVNGLGHAVRAAAAAGIDRANADPNVKAIVITGAGKAFSGGADIKEFNTPKALAEPRCTR